MAITILLIIALIVSAIFHEFAHGWAAYKLGDNTAKDAGRLTLNPIAHLDPFGSVFLPLMLVFLQSPFFIAYAKPVPYNPYNLRDQRWGDLKVAIAGPGTNFILALLFGLTARFIPLAYDMKVSLISGFLGSGSETVLSLLQGSLLGTIFLMCVIFCFINLLLMIFNLIPVPPLDGSKVLMSFLPYSWQTRFQQIEPYGIFIVMFLLLFGAFSFIWPLLIFIFRIIVGI
jgi:Zn-dependent protease